MFLPEQRYGHIPGYVPLDRKVGVHLILRFDAFVTVFINDSTPKPLDIRARFSVLSFLEHDIPSLSED